MIRYFLRKALVKSLAPSPMNFRLIRHSSDDQEFKADNNFDFEEEDLDINFEEIDSRLEREYFDENKQIYQDISTTAVNLIQNNDSPEDFINFVEYHSDVISRRSYSLLMKNFIACIYYHNRTRLVPIFSHKMTVDLIIRVKTDIMKDCHDLELVDFLCLISTARSKSFDFITPLEISAEFLRQISNEIVSRIQSSVYDLRSLIRIGEASIPFKMTYLMHNCIKRISTLLITNPSGVKTLENYMVIKLMNIIETAIDLGNNIDIIMRCVIFSKECDWHDFPVGSKMTILKKILYSKSLAKNRIFLYSRMLAGDIIGISLTDNNLAKIDIALALQIILCRDSNLIFPKFNEIVFKLLETDLNSQQRVLPTRILKFLIEIIYINSVNNKSIYGLKGYLDQIKRYLRKPIGDKEKLFYWHKISQSLNTILLMNSEPAFVEIFSPLIRELADCFFKSKGSIIIIQHLKKDEIKELILRLQKENPELLLVQEKVVNYLNLYYKLGLETELNSMTIRCDFNHINNFNVRFSDKMLENIMNENIDLSLLNPSILFCLLNESVNYLPRRQAFYKQLLEVFSQNVMRFFRFSGSIFPVYLNTPLVLIDLLIYSYPKFHSFVSPVLIEMLNNKPIIGTQLINAQHRITEKLIDILDLVLKSKSDDTPHALILHLASYYFINFLLPNRTMSRSNELIFKYLEFLKMKNIFPNIHLLASFSEHFVLFDSSLLLSESSPAIMFNNIHNFGFFYPSVINTNLSLKESFKKIKTSVDKEVAKNKLKAKDLLTLLKTRESREEIFETRPQIASITQNLTLFTETFIVLLIHDLRFGNIISHYSKMFSELRFVYPRDFLEFCLTTVDFCDINKISPVSFRIIQKTSKESNLNFRQFAKHNLNYITRFMNTFFITNRNFVDNSELDGSRLFSCDFFFSNVLLFEYNSNWVAIKAYQISKSPLKISLESLLSIWIVLINEKNQTSVSKSIAILLKKKTLKESCDSFDDYYLHLIHAHIKVIQPIFEKQFSTFLLNIGLLPLKEVPALKKPKSNLRSFLSEKGLIPIEYSRNGIRLKATEIYDQKIVIVESTAGPSKIDFISNLETTYINNLSPELKVISVCLCTWYGTEHENKSDYLKSIGIRLPETTSEKKNRRISTEVQL
jgi:hypothetical protein